MKTLFYIPCGSITSPNPNDRFFPTASTDPYNVDSIASPYHKANPFWVGAEKNPYDKQHPGYPYQGEGFDESLFPAAGDLYHPENVLNPYHPANPGCIVLNGGVVENPDNPYAPPSMPMPPASPPLDEEEESDNNGEDVNEERPKASVSFQVMNGLLKAPIEDGVILFRQQFLNDVPDLYSGDFHDKQTYCEDPHIPDNEKLTLLVDNTDGTFIIPTGGLSSSGASCLFDWDIWIDYHYAGRWTGNSGFRSQGITLNLRRETLRPATTVKASPRYFRISREGDIDIPVKILADGVWACIPFWGRFSDSGILLGKGIGIYKDFLHVEGFLDAGGGDTVFTVTKQSDSGLDDRLLQGFIFYPLRKVNGCAVELVLLDFCHPDKALEPLRLNKGTIDIEFECTAPVYTLGTSQVQTCVDSSLTDHAACVLNAMIEAVVQQKPLKPLETYDAIIIGRCAKPKSVLPSYPCAEGFWWNGQTCESMPPADPDEDYDSDSSDVHSHDHRRCIKWGQKRGEWNTPSGKWGESLCRCPKWHEKIGKWNTALGKWGTSFCGNHSKSPTPPQPQICPAGYYWNGIACVPESTVPGVLPNEPDCTPAFTVTASQVKIAHRKSVLSNIAKEKLKCKPYEPEEGKSKIIIRPHYRTARSYGWLRAFSFPPSSVEAWNSPENRNKLLEASMTITPSMFCESSEGTGNYCMRYLFCGCRNLKLGSTFTFTDDWKNVTKAGNAFMFKAFQACESLDLFPVDYKEPQNFTVVGEYFKAYKCAGCKRLQHIGTANNEPQTLSMVHYGFEMFEYHGCERLLVLPEDYTEVREVYDSKLYDFQFGKFMGCTRLRWLPDRYRETGIIAAGRAAAVGDNFLAYKFSESGLESLPHGYAEPVIERVGNNYQVGMFAGCARLERLPASYVEAEPETKGINFKKWKFQDCTLLEVDDKYR